MRRRIDSSVLLLMTPILWGATFPAGKLALLHMPPFAFMAWTRTLGLLAILAAVPLLARGETTRKRPHRSVVWPGVLLGALIFGSYVLQTEGLARTTSTNAGFITCLYVVFTPIIAAVVFRQRIQAAAWLAVGISLVGLVLLSVQDLGAIHFRAGDLLVFAGAVGWAGHVTGVGYFSPKFPAWMLSVAQMAATVAFQLVASVKSGLALSAALSGSVFPLLFVTGVLGSGVAYTLQVIAQQTLSATRAVVLLAGEAIFAALFGAIWTGDRLSLHQWFGAAIALVAMVYSELSARRRAAALIEPASAP